MKTVLDLYGLPSKHAENISSLVSSGNVEQIANQVTEHLPSVAPNVYFAYNLSHQQKLFLFGKIFVILHFKEVLLIFLWVSLWEGHLVKLSIH
jgi:hypothetical protein